MSCGSWNPNVKKNNAFKAAKIAGGTHMPRRRTNSSPKVTSTTPRANPSIAAWGNTQWRIKLARGVVGNAAVTRGTIQTAAGVTSL